LHVDTVLHRQYSTDLTAFVNNHQGGMRMAKMFIAGESTASSSGQTYDVINPATGEVVDSAPKGNESDARAAIDAAHAAFQAWSETAAEARAQLMLKGIESVKKELQDLAVTLTREQGKPIGDSQREIE